MIATEARAMLGVTCVAVDASGAGAGAGGGGDAGAESSGFELSEVDSEVGTLMTVSVVSLLMLSEMAPALWTTGGFGSLAASSVSVASLGEKSAPASAATSAGSGVAEIGHVTVMRARASRATTYVMKRAMVRVALLAAKYVQCRGWSATGCQVSQSRRRQAQF